MLGRDSGLDGLIKLLSKIPGLGPRSARRAALHMVKNKESVLKPLTSALNQAYENIKTCTICNNLDVCNPCSICSSHKRDARLICVVEDVSDLWAIERSNIFSGFYHVLGGTLSAIDAIGPEQLGLPKLVARVQENDVAEVIIATNATIEGQTTAHYIYDMLKGTKAKVSRLAHGIPIGGELDYLDDGTLNAALSSRLVMG